MYIFSKLSLAWYIATTVGYLGDVELIKGEKCLAYQPSPIIIISQLLSLLLRKSVHHVVQDVIRRNSGSTCLDFRTKTRSNEKTRLNTNILLCLVQ